MRSYGNDRDAIGSHLVANAPAGIPIQWPNQSFDRPELSDEPATPARFVAFDLRYDAEGAATTLGGTSDRVGWIDHGVWVQLGVDEQALTNLADQLVSMWDAANISGFTINALRNDLGPVVENGSFQGRLLSVRFWSHD